VNLRANQSRQVDGIARELLAIAARARMDAYVKRAVEFLEAAGSPRG